MILSLKGLPTWIAGGLAVLMVAAGTYLLTRAEPLLARPVERGVAPAEVVFSVATTQPEVALTFDDGPDPRFTPGVLTLLNAYGDRGTFFVLGSQARSYPALVRAIEQQGSEVGAHGLHHRSLIHVGRITVEREVTGADQAIARITGRLPTLFRPPYGNTGPVLLSVLRAHQQIAVLWTVDTRDWSTPGASTIVKAVMTHIHPGAIVLFHDSGGDRSQTLTALRTILPELRQQGYRAVTVSQLLRDGRPVAHYAAN